MQGIAKSETFNIVGNTLTDTLNNPKITKQLKRAAKVVPVLIDVGSQLMKMGRFRIKVALFLIFLVFALIVFIIVILVFYFRPILPSACHSIDYRTYYSKKYVPGFRESLKMFQKFLPKYATSLCGSSLTIVPTSQFSIPVSTRSAEIIQRTIVATNSLVNIDDATMNECLRLYFSYYQCFDQFKKPPYSLFCPSAICKEDAFRVTTGEFEIDEGEVEKFKRDFVRPLELLRNATLAMSKIAESQNLQSQSWYSADSREASNWILSLHQVRMNLNDYFDAMNSMAMNRIVDKSGINVWIIYFLPFVKDILQNKIPNAWRSLRPTKDKFQALWDKGWTWLIKFISELPTKIFNKAMK